MTDIKEKLRRITYILFPKFWKNRYKKYSLENTVINNVYVEWWGHRVNRGDWLSIPVVEYMLQRKGIKPLLTTGGGH